MGPARIAVLAVAVIAAIAAALLMRSLSNNGPEAPVIAIERPQRDEEPKVFVLSSVRDVMMGEHLAPEDLKWTEWPEAAIGPSFVVQEYEPEAMDKYATAVARTDIAQNEPLLPNKVLFPGSSGFMSAMLTSGMRAIAIPISVESGAGGFILPGDHVDILLTYGGPQGTVTETILENVRVLAIDQILRESEESVVIVGSTATLELSPANAEMVSRSVAVGEVSLALRAAADIDQTAQQTLVSQRRRPVQTAIQVYRYGGSQQVAVQDPQGFAQ